MNRRDALALCFGAFGLGVAGGAGAVDKQYQSGERKVVTLASDIPIVNGVQKWQVLSEITLDEHGNLVKHFIEFEAHSCPPMDIRVG